MHRASLSRHEQKKPQETSLMGLECFGEVIGEPLCAQTSLSKPREADLQRMDSAAAQGGFLG